MNEQISRTNQQISHASEKKVFKTAVLKYPEGSPAPFLVAKGKGDVAKQILEIAKKNDVPIIKDVAETEVLTMMEIGQCIPEQTYETMAKIFAFIKSFEQK